RTVEAGNVAAVHDVVDALVQVLVVGAEGDPADDADGKPGAEAPVQRQVPAGEILVADLPPARDVLAALARVPRSLVGPLVVAIAVREHDGQGTLGRPVDPFLRLPVEAGAAEILAAMEPGAGMDSRHGPEHRSRLVDRHVVRCAEVDGALDPR